MQDSEDGARVGRQMPLPELSVGAWVVGLSFLTILGADLMWAVAIGDMVRETAAVPSGIPFASAPQVAWHNPIVLGQLVLSLVHAVVPGGLATFHLLIVGLTLTVLLIESRRMGGGNLRTTVALALTVIGCLAPFVVTRLPDLSLLPFVVAVAAMRRQHERPRRSVWWLVPLFALWGNLHGGVLVGIAVLGVFLLLSPGGGRPLERVALGAASVVSLVLTPAGLGTPAYYVGVLTNEAAARKSDLWAAPNLTRPLDLAMLGAAAVLLAMCFRRGLPRWEWVAIAGLVVGTLMAARNGVWLVLFIAPAAAGLRACSQVPVGTTPERPRWWIPVVASGVVVTVVATGLSLSRRGDSAGPGGASVVETVRAIAAGGSVLADEPLAETLAQAGITVWAANPIDAFPRSVQADFLDFLHDGRVPTRADVEVVVIDEARVDKALAAAGWVESARLAGYRVLTRSP